MAEPPNDLLHRIMEGITNLSHAIAEWAPAPAGNANGARPRTRSSTSTSTRAATAPPPAHAPALDHVDLIQQQPGQPGNINMRREFETIFGLNRSRSNVNVRARDSSSNARGRGRGSAARGRGRGGRTSSASGRPTGTGVFYKDVVLLDYGAETSPSKLQALSAGRACCMLPLHRQLSEREIEELVESSFESQLKALDKPRFEFVKVIHHRVVVPHMRRGQMWDGMAIRSLCGQGDLYVRATAPLPVAEEEGTEDGDDPQPEVVSGTDDEDLSDPGILPARDPVTLNRRGNAREIRTPVHRHDASDALINILEEEEGDFEEEMTMDEEPTATLKGELSKLSSSIDTSRTNLISVFRGNVLAGAFRALKRPNFDPRASLDILFSSGQQSEGAIDMGGPRKEFFRLCVREVLRKKIFEGPANELQLTLNQQALDTYMYKDCGTLIALSLVHGGPGPRAFSPATYRRLAMQSVYGENDQANLQDVADHEVRSKISKVLDASSSAEFNAAIEDPVIDTIMTLNGLHGPSNTFGNKLEVGRSLIKTIQGNRLEPCFSQFREGLSTLGVLASMKAYPDVWFDPFCVNQAPRSSRELLSLFECRLSPEGSNQAAAEARTLAWWGDFAADCEAGVTDPVISMGDILTFVTCLQDEPAGGFDPSPSITFTQGRYPEANTCSNVLRLPVCHETYEEFMKKMIEGIIGGQGFGQT